MSTLSSFLVIAGGVQRVALANTVARALREKRPDREVVVTSIMEHHSNDLPHGSKGVAQSAPKMLLSALFSPLFFATVSRYPSCEVPSLTSPPLSYTIKP